MTHHFDNAKGIVMEESRYILALDQGTTSTRALAFSLDGAVLDTAQVALKQHYPSLGWVEHDAEDIWQASQMVMKTVIDRQKILGKIPLTLGITNQRETVVAWDAKSGKPYTKAIVWQDRRTAKICESLVADGHAPMVAEKTGLVLDPYFSATKINWLLDEGGLRPLAEAGDLLVGTIESYLIYRLTKGKQHITDLTNASRTMLCNIHTGVWDDDLLNLFNVPRAILPKIVENIGDFGCVANGLFGAGVPINAAIGDQQSAAVGQGCIKQGMVKSTFGTGCFLLQNTGTKPIESNHKLLTTVAYSIDAVPKYALEGSIFNAGTVVQFFRDQMSMIEEAEETEALARSVADTDGVYMVPAFTGLGAPHWLAEAKGMVCGLTRNTSKAHLVRAGLEAVVYQTYDLLDAFETDSGLQIKSLRVDGGMATNDWLMQYLSDILNIEVARPKSVETTAWGAALLAGLQCGVWKDLTAAVETWAAQSHFKPSMMGTDRNKALLGWHDAIKRLAPY